MHYQYTTKHKVKIGTKRYKKIWENNGSSM